MQAVRDDPVPAVRPGTADPGPQVRLAPAPVPARDDRSGRLPVGPVVRRGPASGFATPTTADPSPRGLPARAVDVPPVRAGRSRRAPAARPAHVHSADARPAHGPSAHVRRRLVRSARPAARSECLAPTLRRAPATAPAAPSRGRRHDRRTPPPPHVPARAHVRSGLPHRIMSLLRPRWPNPGSAPSGRPRRRTVPPPPGAAHPSIVAEPPDRPSATLRSSRRPT